MKCDICGQPNAFNFYGIAILDRGTLVGNARWGQNVTEAHQRALENARAFIGPEDFVYDVKVVVAHTRAEVRRAYEV